MITCCSICYEVNSVAGWKSIPSRERGKLGGNGIVTIHHRFFILFERYLNYEGEAGGGRGSEMGRTDHFPFPIEKLSKIRMAFCGKCVKLMESFCETYEQMKKTEAVLNSKVEMIKSVMEDSLKPGGSTLIQNIRKCIGNMKVKEDYKRRPNKIIDSLIKSKESLVSKCSRKLSKSFPRVTIARCRIRRQKPLIGKRKAVLISNDIPAPVKRLCAEEYDSDQSLDQAEVTTTGDGVNVCKSPQDILNDDGGSQVGVTSTQPGKEKSSVDVEAIRITALEQPVPTTEEKIEAGVNGDEPDPIPSKSSCSSANGKLRTDTFPVEFTYKGLVREQELTNPKPERSPVYVPSEKGKSGGIERLSEQLQKPDICSCRQCKKPFTSEFAFKSHFRAVHCANPKPKAEMVKRGLYQPAFSGQRNRYQQLSCVGTTIEQECPNCRLRLKGTAQILYRYYGIEHLSVKFECRGCNNSFSHFRKVPYHPRNYM